MFSGEEVIIRLRGQNLTLPYLQSNGFSRPILVEGKDGLGLAIPQENFTVQDVEHYVGLSITGLHCGLRFSRMVSFQVLNG